MIARRIVAVRDESEGACIVELECGHSRHVRDRPPFESFPWVRDPAERSARVGTAIECGLCDAGGEDRHAPEELRAVDIAGEYAIATWKNLLVVVLRPGVPEAFARVSGAQIEQQARYGNRLVSLTILEGDFTALFSARSRALAREQLARSSGPTRQMALVVLRGGLLASATRTTMNALSALMRLEVEWRTFAAIQPACAWLAPNVLPPVSPEDVEAIADRVLAMWPVPR